MLLLYTCAHWRFQKAYVFHIPAREREKRHRRSPFDGIKQGWGMIIRRQRSIFAPMWIHVYKVRCDFLFHGLLCLLLLICNYDQPADFSFAREEIIYTLTREWKEFYDRILQARDCAILGSRTRGEGRRSISSNIAKFVRRVSLSAHQTNGELSREIEFLAIPILYKQKSPRSEYNVL